MMSIEKYGKIYYCLLKDNRQVDDTSVPSLTGLWTALRSETENDMAKRSRPKDFRVIIK